MVLLEGACRPRDLSLLAVTPNNLESTLQALADSQVSFRVLFDRASDTDERFLRLEDWARLAGAHRINSFELARSAWDKAAMHAALSPVLPTPYAVVLPPFAERPDLPSIDLAPLGESFHIKPAHGGGGKGVVTGATSLDQVQAARQQYPADTYMLQAHVVATHLGDRPAWFRIISCIDRVFPCWWDPATHRYTPVTPEEEAAHGLAPLREMTSTIGRLCHLELFSSEITLTADHRFVVVDYVNDPIDLRMQSKTPDGVPDSIVQAVADGLAAFAAVCCHQTKTSEV